MFRQIATFAILASQVSVSMAQEVRDIEPAWRVVSQDATPARSGPDGVYYSVAELNSGTVVRVDGEAGSYARVRYPQGITVLVPVDEIRLIDEGRVELVKNSGLRAPSQLMGMSGSWMAVFEPPLPSGTVLSVVGTEKNSGGDVVGYRVRPPAPPAVTGYARMYIASDALREATPAEVEKHLGTAGTEKAAEKPAAQPQTQPQTEPQQPEAQPGSRDLGVRELKEGEQAQPEQPATTEPRHNEGDPVELTPRQPAQHTTDQTRREPTLLPAGLEELEASFEAARKQPADEADQALDELLAEFQRTRASTDDEDRLAWQLDQRIEWLKLRMETRDQRRAIRAALAEADERAEALQAKADEWQKSRAFQLVGLLVESSVYNGERLPRMYRVQAVSTLDGTPRTLGYIKPESSMDRMLGSVVGIVGEARFDPQLRLMVIRPERVDVMPK